VQAADRLGLDVAMADVGNHDLLLTRGLSLSVTDNALGGFAVHVAWERSRGLSESRTSRRLLQVLEEILGSRSRRRLGAR